LNALWNWQITKLPNYEIAKSFLILAFPRRKDASIQLHSSQNNNVVLFFVVHVSTEHGTNLFISKYLIRYPQASTGGMVEIPG